MWMKASTGTPWLVRLYDEFGRHTLAYRGEKTIFDDKGERTTTAIAVSQGPAHFTLSEWHEYRLVCIGNHLSVYVDGILVSEAIDNDPAQQDFTGILALQLHSGPPMTVQFKDITLKKL